MLDSLKNCKNVTLLSQKILSFWKSKGKKELQNCKKHWKTFTLSAWWNSDFHSEEMKRIQSFGRLFYIFQFFGGKTIRRRNNSRPGARAKISGSWPYNSTNLCFSLLYRAFATSNWGPSSYTSDREVKTGIVSSSMFPAITSSSVLHPQKTLKQKETKKPKIQSNNKTLSQKTILSKNIQTNTCWHRNSTSTQNPKTTHQPLQCVASSKSFKNCKLSSKDHSFLELFGGLKNVPTRRKNQTNNLVFTKV